MTFHHLGIATRTLAGDARAYATLGYRVDGEEFADPQQGVRGVFLVGGGPRLELLEPLPGSTTLEPLLQRGIKCYHQAYEVESIEDSCAALRTHRARVIRAPVPAVAFDGRRITFLALPNGWMVELIELP